MKAKYSKFTALLLIVFLTIGFSACGKKEAATNAKPETKVDQIKKAGKIVLGTSADYPPYEFIKEIDGKATVVGFDVSIAKEIAKDLGVELEIKEMQFDGLLQALQAGKVDFVLAGMTPKPERLESADFSNIYYKAVQTVVIRSADKDKIKTVDDLKGGKVGVQKGSIQVDVAKEQLPNSEAKELGKITDIVLSLKTDKVNAAIIEEPVAKSYVNANSDIVISDIKLAVDDAGSAVAVAKGNKELVDEINKTISRLEKDNLIQKHVTDATNLVE
jgi:polar amino acid transport system substrate-binding protein